MCWKMGSSRIYTALLIVCVISIILYIVVLYQRSPIQITSRQGQQYRLVSLLRSIFKMEFDHRVNIEDCEVIHIAIICTGIKASSDVIPVIKSLVFFRRNPLHFHFITDFKAKNILQQQFVTWNISEVDVSFYSSEKAKTFVSWIPSKHYSGIYALMKLTLTEILPQNLQKVLLLDTDVLCIGDIAELWEKFKSFNETQVIGLAENLSEWYLSEVNDGAKPWPALGSGFNTGVILLNLQKLRQMNWTGIWNKVTAKELVHYKSTHLGDQDIINAVIVHNPIMVYRLLCKWNVQLKSNRATCSKELSTYKIVHWNAAPESKFVSVGSLGNTALDFFTKLRLRFLQSEINRYRRSTLRC